MDTNQKTQNKIRQERIDFRMKNPEVYNIDNMLHREGGGVDFDIRFDMFIGKTFLGVLPITGGVLFSFQESAEALLFVGSSGDTKVAYLAEEGERHCTGSKVSEVSASKSKVEGSELDLLEFNIYFENLGHYCLWIQMTGAEIVIETVQLVEVSAK